MDDAEVEYHISAGWMQALKWVKEMMYGPKEGGLTLESLDRILEVEAGICKRKMLAHGAGQFSRAGKTGRWRITVEFTPDDEAGT